MAAHTTLIARAFALTALWGAVCSAPAQSAVPVNNQSVFSPSSDPAAGSRHFDVTKQLSAPHAIFNQPDDSDAPMLAPPPSPLQQMVRQKPDWTTMTPDEILGLTKPGQAKDNPSLNARRPAAYQSPLENFLLNQRLAQTGYTNLNRPGEGWNFMDQDPGLAGPRRQNDLRDRSSIIKPQIFNRMLQNADDSFNQNPMNTDAAWVHVFSTPPPSAPNPAQLADMTAFQQLLQPTSPAAATSRSASGFTPAAPLPDSNLEPLPAGYNPAGASFHPLDENIGRPKRLAGLPSATAPAFAPAPAPPAWAPKPPPWTLTSPQLFNIPARKY